MSTRPLRITEVVTTEVFAGTERYVVDVSRELARRGHRVTVVGGRPEAMTRLTGPDVRWEPGGSLRPALRALARGGPRDVVHSHMTKSDFVATAAAPLVRAARVSTRHITVPRGFSAPARLLAPVVRRGLDAEITVSHWASEQLERPADLVLVNGVAPVADVDGPRSRTVLVAQRLDHEKDTVTALGAWALSGLGDRGWRLVVAGTGTEQAMLRRLAGTHGVAGSVRFPGWVDDVDALYRDSALLLAPAPTEPCGLTVIEAMAHGLPVVAAAAGGHLETVGLHSAAALFAPGDVRAAADHLVRLADDDDARLAYGTSLRELQRRHLTIASHVDRLEQLYTDLAERRRRGVGGDRRHRTGISR